MTPEPVAIDPNNPFTRDLLRSLAGTLPAQPDETDAEYEARFAAATAAWASFHPRDPMEQMLAAQIVGAHYSILECLNRAMQAEDPALADKLWRTHATLTRTTQTTMRLLDKHRQRPADTAPPLAIEPVPPPRRRPVSSSTGLTQGPAQHPIHREKAPRPPMKDPAKMTDAEIEACKAEIRTECAIALLDPRHPDYQEALAFLPELLPEGMVVTGRSRDVCLLPD